MLPTAVGTVDPRYSLSNPWVRPRLRPAASVRSPGEKSQLMSTRQVVLASAALLGLFAISVGLLAHEGSLTGPGPVGAALRGARAALHGELEQRESAMPAGRTRDDGLWRAYLAVVERELERGRVDAAVRAWHDAYSAALASRSWESMIAVG